MTVDDIPRQHAFFQDPELHVLDCDYPRVTSPAASQAFYESRTKPDENTAPFAIEADDKYIGFCSLMHLQNRHRHAELGIMIGDRDYWGRGYGKEVVRLLLDYGFRYIGLHRIGAFPNEKNLRSIGCLKACGFIEEGRARKVLWLAGEWVDVVQLSILAEEWQAI